MESKQREQRYLRWYGKHLGVLFIALERNGTIVNVLSTILAIFNYAVICYIVGIVFAPIGFYPDVPFGVLDKSHIVVGATAFGYGVSLVLWVLFFVAKGIRNFFNTDYRETLQEYGRKDK